MDAQNKKASLGQFFTKSDVWLKDHILQFILDSKMDIAYDPFAGAGDLLNVASKLGFSTVGLDIDASLGWQINDSLNSIPRCENAIIITNPPYLAKQSATRQKIDYSSYFIKFDYDDIYLIALENMVNSHDFVVAIIPESFLNSAFKHKHLLNSVTVLEENPFDDTENPVCVACFDGKYKGFDKISIYKNDDYLGTLDYFEDCRIVPTNKVNMSFNSKQGWLALRAIDSSKKDNPIKFCFKNELNYDWENKIKESSRHITLIDIDIGDIDKRAFIKEANKILNDLRLKTQDIILTPFKGNTKDGIRRRRLDFKLARGILERAYEKIKGESYEQLRLF